MKGPVEGHQVMKHIRYVRLGEQETAVEEQDILPREPQSTIDT